MNTDDLRVRILSINEFSSADDVASVRNDVIALNALGRDLKRDTDTATLEWIDTNGDLTSGNMRWYAGVDRDYEVKDAGELLAALFGVCGGDFAQVASCLSSNAFKVGACRAALETAFDAHFTETKGTIVKDGKPKKIVKVTNADFAGKADE